MISFPNCKINLGLNIIHKRTDGYHNIETVFYPLQLNDILEIIPNNVSCAISEIKSNQLNIEFTSSGLFIEGNADNNLCIKAYRLLKKDFPTLPSVQIHLHKHILIGAGLGGGSADAAFTLQLLNKKFNLNLSQEQLIDYALQLGSDCPFFIYNQPCFASSRGEKLQPIDLQLSAYQFVIVNPAIHISTAWAFSQIKPKAPDQSIHKIITMSIEKWKHQLINDFEEPVFKAYPEIELIKNTLYNAGAVYASMSGSGSTVYGIFKKDALPDIHFPEHYLHIRI